MTTTKIKNGPCLTLHYSGGTTALATSIRANEITDGFTGKRKHQIVLRAASGPYRYEWNLRTLIEGGVSDEIVVPGNLYVSGMKKVAAWAVKNGRGLAL